MDNLEKFINQNRSSFDDQVPNLDVWSKIDDQLDQQTRPKTRQIRMYSYVSRVAAAGTCERGCFPKWAPTA